MLGDRKVNRNEFPRVSRERLKVIDTESEEIGDGKTSAPTVEEAEWLKILKSTAPELEKLRKKLSVCYIADVVEYDASKVTFSYDGETFTINKPVNGLRIARAREYSIMSALEELNAQRCITQNGVPIAKDFSGIDTEVIQLMASVAEKFFFTPYL